MSRKDADRHRDGRGQVNKAQTSSPRLRPKLHSIQPLSLAMPATWRPRCRSRPAHALTDLQKSDELKPKNSFVIYNIGEVYAGKSDLARAEAEHRNALALAPANQKIIEGLRRIGATP